MGAGIQALSMSDGMPVLLIPRLTPRAFMGAGIQALSVSDGIPCYAPAFNGRPPFGKRRRSICDRENNSTRHLL
jgi:hypothetical protein